MPRQFQAHGLPIPALDVQLDIAENLQPPSMDVLPLSVTNLSPRRVHGVAKALPTWAKFPLRKASTAPTPSALAGGPGGGAAGGGRDVHLPRVPVPSPLPSGDADGDDAAYGGPSPASSFNSVQTSPGQLAAKAAEWLSLRPPQAHALVAAQRATGYGV